MNTVDSGLIQLHLGVGSFHRAHQAVYMQNLHEKGQDTWHIVGGNVRPDMEDTIKALREQSGEYHLETVSPTGERNYQKIAAIKTLIDWDAELKGLIEVAVNPNTRIISFTVTEAGYYLDEHHQLDANLADIKSDLAGDTRCTIYGAMAALLSARMEKGAGPITLMNCDNLRSNGHRFYDGLTQYLKLSGATELLEWVENNTSAPDSMVDRITPRPTSEVISRVSEAVGVTDNAALMGESFIQWVIEDKFIAGRPNWEDAGAELVDDVMPYEEAKIRLLNATHSCIAWAGTLRGYQFIHEGAQDPVVRQLAFDYVTDDVIPCLDTEGAPSPLNLADYRDVVLDRFSNPHVEDTNQRVVMDGYSKIPGFILPTISEAIEGGRSINAVAMLPALFLAFIKIQQRGELAYTYQDAAMPADNPAAYCNAEDSVLSFASEPLLFGQLAGNEVLISALRLAETRVNDLIKN